MKLLFHYVLSLFLLAFCSSLKKHQSIDISGSDTLLELTQIQAEEFYNQTKQGVNLTGGGSGVGITMLLEKQTNIANLSRNIKDDEIQMSQKVGIHLQAVPIAIDMLSIIVHKDNPVTYLSEAQVRDIYLGKITNWKEVGGADLAISLYGRQSSSGTYQFFQEMVLKKQDFSPQINEVTGSPQVISSLQVDKGGIAYVGLSDALKRQNHIKVIHYDGFDPAKIINTPNQKKYKLYRYLLEVINQDVPSPQIDAWFEFILSPKGDLLVEKGGFIPLPAKEKHYIKTVKKGND